MRVTAGRASETVLRKKSQTQRDHESRPIFCHFIYMLFRSRQMPRAETESNTVVAGVGAGGGGAPDSTGQNLPR